MSDNTVITLLGEKMLEVLKESGDWFNRRQLADALRRPKQLLTPHDISTLEMLENEGLIVAEKHSIGTVKFEFRYRSKQ